MQKEVTMAFIRHILTFGGGIVIGLGVGVDETMWQQISGAVVTLIGVGWSLVDKKPTEPKAPVE